VGVGVWWVKGGLIASVVETAVSYGDMRSAEKKQTMFNVSDNQKSLSLYDIINEGQE
jgi:hypothetical protein